MPGAGDCALGPSVCSTPPELIPLYKVTGSQTLVVEPTTWNVSLQGPASIWIGDTATYSAQRIGGGELYVTEWLWQPDAGGPPVTPTCIGASSATPLTCRTAPRSSGTMYVRARTGPHSVIEQADRHTDVERPRLTVTARPTRLIRGKAATFVARITAAPARLGTISLGSVQWRWKASTEGAVPACASGDTVCVYKPTTSGRMQAYAVILGEPDSAVVSVNVFACDTTGVPEFDDIDMRDRLDDFHTRRRAIGQYGKEGLAALWPSDDGGFIFKEMMVRDATACGADLNEAVTDAMRGGLMVHPHFNDVLRPGGLKPQECKTPDIQVFQIPGSPKPDTIFLPFPPDTSSRFRDPLPEPSRSDWEWLALKPGVPERHGIVTDESVLFFRRTSDQRLWVDANAKRFSRKNWKTCAQNPI